MRQKMTAVMVAVVLAAGTMLAAEPPKMKMTTEIPKGLTTPDDIQTRVGELSFFDEPWFDKTWRPGEIELVK